MITITASENRKNQPTLIITRGLPGSGKSTAAVAWVRADQAWRVRINRDDLRSMGHGGRLGLPAQEAIVSAIQHAGVQACLSHGTSVIVDDTNLSNSAIARLLHLANEVDANFEVWDFRDVDVEECVRRDTQRDGMDRVGEDVIRAMHEKHILNSAAEDEPDPTRAMIKG
jgi:predicted kinase